MGSHNEKYIAIASLMREQLLPEQPLKHEWLELLSLISQQDDPALRSIGVAELRNCLERAERNTHV